MSASARVAVLLENIKFAHTIFALPFAYTGMALAAGGWPTWGQFLWITVAMAAARTLAMSANRLIDAEIDARNARTANRPLPRGRVSRAEVAVVIGLTLALFLIAAASLNRLTLALAPLALIFLIGYSYTKRFTWASHWVLGITDGAAAAGGWVAVTGRFEAPLWLLWFAVAVWIAGFDIIYACQDVEFDRREGLHSVPARFGIENALLVARVCHGLTAAALAALGLVMGLGALYWVGWLVTVALLVREHTLVRPGDLSKLGVAFFNVNGYISIIVFVAALADLLVRRA
ncbi:MAG: UbiA-like polyprenyltransferase [Anaerolineae bacterium]